MGIIQNIKDKILGRSRRNYSEVPQNYQQPVDAPNLNEYIRKRKIMDMEKAYFERERMKAQKQFYKDKAKRDVQEYYDERQGVANRVVKYAQKQRRANYPVASAVGREFGVRVPQQGYQGKKGYAGKGRPRGPSGRYYIPGKGAVGVFEYRRYMAQRRLMARMQQDQMAKQGYVQQPQQQYQQQSQPQYSQQQQYQQQPQYVEQQPEGINLTGGFDLLNVGMNKNINAPKKSVWDVETPKDYGDYYTEPDFMSGKQILRRRVRQMPKW